jgi:hypothetical protein
MRIQYKVIILDSPSHRPPVGLKDFFCSIEKKAVQNSKSHYRTDNISKLKIV